VNASG